ncbi:hypothetical protein QMZ93_12320 [Pantoea stewartii subsp. indologenes]|uniref:hypothetical protein n=1 Tax=Pantoea stewartii TaxID=66269 RepID=UPI0019809EB3|nr:hypothetical protein [Pantoea stewartii]MDK2634116.1 hypothetical protein [Pantoea stewartii subsp. indologenes]
MRVKVLERNNIHALMHGEYDKQIAESNGEPIVEHHLKVDRCTTSDALFGNLPYRQSQSLSINSGAFKDFYYTGRDDVGYIFSTRP